MKTVAQNKFHSEPLNLYACSLLNIITIITSRRMGGTYGIQEKE
jgi:hypothetical protein